MSKVTIYHNPKCATSRNALAIIKDSGVEPEVVEYLKTPLTREALAVLVEEMKVEPRDILRTKGGLYKELGLNDASLSDDALLDAIAQHPVLMERPIVVTVKGAVLCRPYALVEALL